MSNETTANPIHWVEIYVNDMQRATKFYEAVFQVTLEPMQVPPKEGLEMTMFPMDMNAYGSACALAKMDGVSAGPGGTLVYFSCNDCADELSRVAAAGGQVVHDKFSIGEHGFIAIIGDSEGNIVGLHSMV